jgi:hypothetical protein
MKSDLMSHKPRWISSARNGTANTSKSLQHQNNRSFLMLRLNSLAMLLLRDECTLNRGSCHIASASSSSSSSKTHLHRQLKGNNMDNIPFLLSAS